SFREAGNYVDNIAIESRLELIAFTIFMLSFLLTMPNKTIAQVGNYGLIYQSSYNNAMFLTTKGAIERNMRHRSSEMKSSSNASSKSLSADLNFSPSDQVHTKVLQSMAKIMSNGDEAKIKPNVNLLVNANLLNKFDQLLRQYNFNSYNIADVVCAFTILSWQTATGNDAAKTPAGIVIFRKNMLATLSNNDGIRNFNNAQKQELAETISYLAVLITLANQDPATRSNASALLQLRQNAREAALKITGMDVTKYTLTQTGFIPKSN
ncbi:MAG TPA: DUF6683 family protein, partial [Mucilaginibacter sp.]